jgi:hypothetical protein
VSTLKTGIAERETFFVVSSFNKAHDHSEVGNASKLMSRSGKHMLRFHSSEADSNAIDRWQAIGRADLSAAFCVIVINSDLHASDWNAESPRDNGVASLMKGSATTI